jgi:hypothetical protein
MCYVAVAATGQSVPGPDRLAEPLAEFLQRDAFICRGRDGQDMAGFGRGEMLRELLDAPVRRREMIGQGSNDDHVH